MIEQLFFELIRVAIGTQDSLSYIPISKEWKVLYDMAKKHSLVGVCFAGLQRLGADADEGFARIGINEMLYLTWMGMAAKIQQKNEVVNSQCVELQDRLAKEGFRSCILKGQGNAENYGSLALLRQSGDIDIWLEGGYEEVIAWVQKVAPTKEVNQHHAHFDCFPDTEVEVHYYPFVLYNPFRNKILKRYFANCESSQFVHQAKLPDGSTITAADNIFNLVFQLVHIFHHLFTEGIGLRQMMDYHFVLKHEMEVEKGSSVVAEPVEVQEVQEVVHKLGLDTFASALMWVLGEVFGLEEKYMLWTPDEKNGKFLLNEIMLAGNFGHHDERVPKNMSYWKSFWYLNFHNLRLIRFDYWSWFWTPIMRIKGFVWRRVNGYK